MASTSGASRRNRSRIPGRFLRDAALAGTVVFGAAVLPAVIPALHAQDILRSTNDGVYTAAQAARGKTTFTARCSACHEAERFKGAEFIDGWAKEPLAPLFEMMSSTMPADNPGGLQPQEYGDVLAYILQINAYPTGADELKGNKDAAGAIRLDPPKTP